MSLLPGELTFIKPGSRGFGPKVQINLDKLISSSYLLSGFKIHRLLHRPWKILPKLKRFLQVESLLRKSVMP
jgi:hypothetical protein